MLRSTPSALVEVREAVWANPWQRDTPDSVALRAAFVAGASDFWDLAC